MMSHATHDESFVYTSLVLWAASPSVWLLCDDEVHGTPAAVPPLLARAAAFLMPPISVVTHGFGSVFPARYALPAIVFKSAAVRRSGLAFGTLRIAKFCRSCFVFAQRLQCLAVFSCRLHLIKCSCWQHWQNIHNRLMPSSKPV